MHPRGEALRLAWWRRVRVLLEVDAGCVGAAVMR